MRWLILNSQERKLYEDRISIMVDDPQLQGKKIVVVVVVLGGGGGGGGDVWGWGGGCYS